MPARVKLSYTSGQVRADLVLQIALSHVDSIVDRIYLLDEAFVHFPVNHLRQILPPLASLPYICPKARIRTGSSSLGTSVPWSSAGKSSDSP